jgi:cytochrome c peroxidase
VADDFNGKAWRDDVRRKLDTRAGGLAAWAGFVAVGLMTVYAAREAAAQRQSGRVVADAKYTAPYDAFLKMNRLQEKFAEDETADDYWGFMESRLGNQAGRILIKRPSKGFDDDTFRGWLMFIRSYGNATGIGNCTACHQVPDFTDHAKHNIGTAQEPVATPSLRDLHKKQSFFHDGSAATLEEAITRHVENGRIARQDKRAGVEIEVGEIALTENEVRQVAAFLRSLQSVDRTKFRDYLVDVVIQPVELDFSE